MEQGLSVGMSAGEGLTQQWCRLGLSVRLLHTDVASVCRPVIGFQQTDTEVSRTAPCGRSTVLIPHTHRPIGLRTGSERFSTVRNPNRCRIRHLARIPQVGFRFVESVQ